MGYRKSGWTHSGIPPLGGQTYTRTTQHAAAAKSLQSCPTLCGPIDGSPPGSGVPGILQARTLEWVAISFSNPPKKLYSINYSVNCISCIPCLSLENYNVINSCCKVFQKERLKSTDGSGPGAVWPPLSDPCPQPNTPALSAVMPRLYLVTTIRPR